MTSGQRWKTASSVVVATFAVVLIGVLAVVAQSRAARERRNAEAVLRDYARFAADELAGRIPQQLDYYGFGPGVMEAMRLAGMHAAVPSVSQVANALAANRSRIPDGLASYFRWQDANGVLETGDSVSPDDRRFIADTLRIMSGLGTLANGRTGFVAALVDTHGAVIYSAFVDSTTRRTAVIGALITRESVTARIEVAVRQRALLPASLIARGEGKPLTHITVRDAGGAVLYDGGAQRSDSTLSGTATLAQFGGLRVDAALDPVIAPRLVHGGLPPTEYARYAIIGLLAIALLILVFVQGQRARHLAALQADFVAGVSHELRTPLAQIRMFAETLLLGRVRSDAEAHRSLEIVDREARRLAQLVENLLHVSRGDRAAAIVTPRRVELIPLVTEVVDAFQPLAASREATVSVHADSGIAALADPDALKQMLLNLLDNAVKYGPAGQHVTVSVTTDVGMARLMVDDQGPGIPPRDREAIWRRFARLQRDRGGGKSGTGIGLSVVRELAQLQSGAAFVTAAPGGGARFVIDLPLDRSA